MGRQILFFSILWVANYQTLRTTDLEECLLADISGVTLTSNDHEKKNQICGQQNENREGRIFVPLNLR